MLARDENLNLFVITHFACLAVFGKAFISKPIKQKILIICQMCALIFALGSINVYKPSTLTGCLEKKKLRLREYPSYVLAQV